MNTQPTPQPVGWRRGAVVAVLLLAFGAATYPVWRVALLGNQPTLEELLRLTCSATGPQGPPEWLVKQGVFGSAAAAGGRSSEADQASSPSN